MRRTPPGPHRRSAPRSGRRGGDRPGRARRARRAARPRAARGEPLPRGQPAARPTRVFGGQVAGQALVAAGRTAAGWAVHSLHSYFLRPGDPRVPIVFDVERVRDGRSFTTRRVRAVQHGEVDLHPGASFQLPAAGSSTPSPRRRGAGPRGPADLGVAARRADLPVRGAAAAGSALRRGTAVDVAARAGDGPAPAAGVDAGRRDAADDPMLHVCLLTYASDLTLLASVLAPRTQAVEPGRAGEPGPRDVVPPPVPRRRVAALRVPLAERLGVARAATGRFFTRDGRLGGDGGAGGPGARPRG